MEKIKTNIDFLDHMLDGGFRKDGGLNGIVSLTCIGKTSLLLRIGINVYEQGYKVVLFTSYSDRDKFINLISNIDGFLTLKPLERLILHDANNLNFEDVKEVVDSTKPDIVLIDDLDLTYNDEIDKLLELNTTVLYTKSASINYPYFNNNLFLHRISNVLLNLNQTSTQKNLSLMNIKLIKSRDIINQPENYKNIEVDYKNMTFYYPSKFKRFINKIKLLWWKYLKN